MAASVRIELSSAGIAQLLTSPEVVADITARGERIAAAAGPGFEAEAYTSRYRGGRAGVTVRATTPEAYRAEADDLALTRAVQAAG